MAEKACEVWDVACWGKEGASKVAAGIADDAINNLAKAIMEGMSQMVTTLSTFWVSMPTVNLTSEDGTTASPVVSAVNSELMALDADPGRPRRHHRRHPHDLGTAGAPLKDLLRSLLTLTLVSGLGLGVISILVIAADAFSAAIINRSTDGKGFADAMKIWSDQPDRGRGLHPHRPGPDRIDCFPRPDRADGRAQRHAGDPGRHPAHDRRVHEHGDGQAVVPEGSRLDHRLHSLQAGRGHRVLGRIPADGQDQREGRPDRLHHGVHADGRCPVRPAGADAVRDADGGSRRLWRGSRRQEPPSGPWPPAPCPWAAVAADGAMQRPPTPAPAPEQPAQAQSPKGSAGTSGPRGGGGQPTPGSTGPGGAAGVQPQAKQARPEPGQPPARAGAATGARSRRPGRHGRSRRRTGGVQDFAGNHRQTAQDSTGEGPSGSN